MEFMNIFKTNLLFKGLTENELSLLFNCLKTRKQVFQKNENILSVGNTTEEIGLIVEGQALIIKDDYWGNRSIISELNAGELFGESYACVPGKELEISLIANETTTIIFLNINNIIHTCKNSCNFHHQIIHNLLAISSRKNILLTQKINHLTKRSTREKILSYLSSQSQLQGKSKISIPFDRQELADYLSVDRSALSNELSKMQKEGIISFQKNIFLLH